MSILEQFNQQGFYGPVQFLTEEENSYYTNQLLTSQKELDLMNSDYRCKSNVLFPWINQLSRHNTLVSHVKEILGNNFHCWDTLIWIKDSNSDKYVSWHQDATYWNFLPKESGLTVWITFSGATRDMGCIQYLKGSHKLKQIHHSDVKNNNNLLMRGQTVDYSIDHTVYAECTAGSFLMHSPFIMHGSDANRSNNVRLALGLIYVATNARPIESYDVESTVMISGHDDYNYMVHDPEPMGHWATDVKNWRRAYDRQHANYYKMAQSV